MSIPLGAPIFAQTIDPSDTLDFYVSVSQGEEPTNFLLDDEEIAEYQLALSAEAAAAGLQILAGDRAPIIEGRNISFWLMIEPASRSLPIFTGAGALLGIELTVATTSVPSRTKQRTFGVRVRHQ